MTLKATTDHDALVALEPRVRRSKHQTLIDRLDKRFSSNGRFTTELAKKFPDLERPRPYIPDAWAIDEGQELVFVIEVTDTNGLRSKVEKIVDLGLYLDSILWDLVVIEADVNIGCCRFIEWEELWTVMLLQQVGRESEIPFFLDGRQLLQASRERELKLLLEGRQLFCD